MRFRIKNWRDLQIFYAAILWEAIQACREFPFGQEEVLLGMTLPAAHPVPGSGLALPGSPETVPSKPAGGGFKCTVFCLNQRRYCITSERAAFLLGPQRRPACRCLRLFGVRLLWEAAVGNASPAPLRGAHGPSLFCVFSL